MDRPDLEIPRPTERIASGSVLVFLKEPRPGTVKTRLAAALGDDEAARLYEQWTTTILSGLQPLRADASLIGYYAGDLAAVQRRWDPLVDQWLEQPAGDLGARLAFGFKSTCAVGPAIAIGTDCLDVDVTILQQAFSTLGRTNAVIGPAGDGGYYLLGLKQYSGGLFDHIEWSSPRTYHQQCEAINRAGMTVAELPMLDDIDTIEDWLAYQRRRSP
jgi:rSAM/selenodomain-associated transferase 1